MFIFWAGMGIIGWIYYLMEDEIYKDPGWFGLVGYIFLMLPLSILLGPFTFLIHYLGTMK